MDASLHGGIQSQFVDSPQDRDIVPQSHGHAAVRQGNVTRLSCQRASRRFDPKRKVAASMRRPSDAPMIRNTETYARGVRVRELSEKLSQGLLKSDKIWKCQAIE